MQRMKVSGWGTGWLVFTIGIIVMVLADSVFSYATFHGLYGSTIPGVIDDILFFCSYGIIGIGAYLSKLELG